MCEDFDILKKGYITSLCLYSGFTPVSLDSRNLSFGPETQTPTQILLLIVNNTLFFGNDSLNLELRRCLGLFFLLQNGSNPTGKEAFLSC